MIKIKDYIFNENEIVYINEYDAESLGVMLKGKDKCNFIDGHIEDIEWNYGSQVSSQVSGQVKELEEENKRLELENEKLKEELEVEESTSSNLSGRILKAIEYIHNNQPVFELSSKEQLQEWFENEYYVELLKKLKGEE